MRIRAGWSAALGRADCRGSSGHARVSALIHGFLEYVRYEIGFSPRTVSKYRESLGWFIRDIGDKDVTDLSVVNFVRLKRMMIQRGVGQARISSVVFAMRSFLNYCRSFLGLSTLNPKQIRPPKKAVLQTGFADFNQQLQDRVFDHIADTRGCPDRIAFD